MTYLRSYASETYASASSATTAYIPDYIIKTHLNHCCADTRKLVTITRMRKLLVVGIFATLAPIATLLLFATTLYASRNGLIHSISFQPNIAGYRLFQSIPENEGAVMGVSTLSRDARSALLKKFLTKYKSPLAPLSDYIVLQSDNYGIDYRLIPAIAMQESTGCKFIPEDSYNCWGYGIYGDKVLRFESYEAGIDRVIRGLKKDYYDKGLDTPQKIMHKYTPPSVPLGGPWANGVEFFFNQIENPSEN